MPLTRADMEQIDAYIKAGDIRLARRMLEDNQDDPRAVKALVKFNQQHPPQSPPVHRPAPVMPPRVPTAPVLASPTLTDLAPDLPRDEMADVRIAIKERRYDDARALLVLSDHPDADKMLERLSHLGGGSEKVKRVYEDVDLTAKYQITLFLLIFLTVFGLVALGIFVPEAKKYPNAPGARGLLRLNKVVRFILYGMLALITLYLVLLVFTLAASRF